MLTIVGAMMPCLAVSAETLVIEGPGRPCPWKVLGGEVRRVVDEGSGLECLEWFAQPAVHIDLVHEFDRVDLDRFDCLYVRWKFSGGGAGIIATLEGYPAPDRRRNWYLFKERYRLDQWREAWLDLRMDDDNGQAQGLAPGRLRLTLRLFNHPRKTADEQDWRRVRIADVKFLRHPVRMTLDWRQAAFPQTAEEIACVYPIQLESRLDRPARLRWLPETAQLRRFRLHLPEPSSPLGAGEKRTVPVRLTLPAAEAQRLEPFTQESVPLYLEVEDVPDSRTTLYRGQTRLDVVGVVPPRKERPYFHAPGQRERILALVQRVDWAKAYYDAVLRRADAALKHPFVYPDLVHGYAGSYVCTEHRCNLQPRSPTQHWCPVGQHVIEGNRAVDASYAFQLHTEASQAAHALGLAWYLTGNTAYARKGAEICLAYAERYPRYPLALADASGLQSRIAHAVLGECWWINAGLNRGYDEIAAAGVLSADQQRRIERQVFLEAAVHIQTHRVEKNQQAEINCASGLAAINAGHWALAANAWSGEFGLKDQIELTYDADGYSLENDIGYHFAALLPMVDQGLAYAALGAEFFTPRLKRVFDAPLAYVLDGKVGQPQLYEPAYRVFRDPAYLPLVHEARRRADPLSVTEGVPELPPMPDDPLPSRTLLQSGYTVLRRGRGENISGIQMWWGGPRSRGVPAFLTFTLTFQGVALNDHVERIAYGYKESPFSYHAVANNTVVVDGENHVAVPPRQTGLLTAPWPAAQWVAPPGASPAPGVALARTVALVGHTFVLVDQLRADAAHRYDWVVYPNAAELDALSVPMRAHDGLKADGKGYQWLMDPQRSGELDGRTPVTIQYTAAPCYYQSPPVKTRPVVLDLWPTGRALEVLTARAWLHWHPVKRAMLIARRRAAEACFIATWRLRRPDGKLDSVEVLPAAQADQRLDPSQATAVRVDTGQGVFIVAANPEQRPIRVADRPVTESLAVLGP